MGRGERISLRCGDWPVAMTDRTTSRMWLAAS